MLHVRAGLFALPALLIVIGTVPVFAHETDQFTVPPGREFADIGDTLTVWSYRAVKSGVDRTNTKIRAAIKAKRGEETLKKLQAPMEVAMAVNAAFPPALFAIEDWDRRVQEPGAKDNFPGRVLGYKPFIGVRRHAEFSLDPFRAWNCATVRAYGIYFGTDKLGHFTDMGKHYYREYRKSLDEGKSVERATRNAVELGADGGPIFFSEAGFLGEKTAGAYSNADLVANYMGMMFYRNLTEEVMLHGQPVPPMLERDGPYWKITERVRPNSNFFALFFSEHFDEALNPSRYIEKHRDKIRKGIEEHASETIDRYLDPHGNRRARAYFAQRQKGLSTYWGFDYGHKGDAEKDLLTIANTCFPAAPKELMKPDQRDGVGMSALHLAARDGDVNRIDELLAQGADVNMQVRSGERRSPEWGSTPLHYAVRDGHVDAAKRLIEKGANVNAANDRGVTPLHRAIYDAELTKMLLASGAKPDAADERGKTPLHWAALDGAADAMAALLEGGASVAAADHRGRTPLHVAAEVANAPMVAALVSRKADANAADRFGVAPLHLASRTNVDSVAAALLTAGAEPNARDAFGMTPLHEATRYNNPAIVSRLLDAEADPSLANAYGGTPIDVARKSRNAPVLALLRGSGPEPTAQTATFIEAK